MKDVHTRHEACWGPPAASRTLDRSRRRSVIASVTNTRRYPALPRPFARSHHRKSSPKCLKLTKCLMLTRTASSPACVSAGTSTPRACLSPWPMGWAVRRAAGKQVRRRERDQVRNSPANNFLFRFVGALEERKSWASIFPCAPNESIQHEFRRCCMQSSSPGLRFLLRFLLRSVAQPPRDPAPCRIP